MGSSGGSMPGRIRKFIESITYAGLKPSVRAGAAEGGKPGGLRAMLDRLISGRAPSDPLYLSHRSWKQKLRLGLVVGIPCLLLAGVVALGLSHIFAPERAPSKAPTNAQIVANLLPNLEKTVDTTPKEVEIQDLHTETVGPPKIVGTLKNNTDRVVAVEFTIDLTDIRGSKLDAVTERVEKSPAKSSVPFEFPIDDKDAAAALVRPGSLRVLD